MAEFDPVTGRITLTKAHIASEQGQRLIQLILEIGLDGELSDTELTQLLEWLKSAPQEIPAIRHLRELVTDALNDSVISDEERKILHKQIERVLPATERERLTLARKTFQEKRKTEHRDQEQKEKEEREKLRAEERAERDRERARQLQEYNKPSEAQLRYITGLGGSLPSDATKHDASVLIDRLLHSNGSISPRQQMVLRFWKITPESHWGKAQVSVWMDEWYQGDPDRQLAWELFKDETGDPGTSRNPDRVPLGAGYTYLRKVKGGNKATGAKPSVLTGLWLFIGGIAVLVMIGGFLFKDSKVPSTPSPNLAQPTSEIPQPKPPTATIPVPAEQVAPVAVQHRERLIPSSNSALEALARAGFSEKALQIPATVIDVGILKYVPYLSYRVGDDRELNIYGDPGRPACIEIGLYRGLLNSIEEKQRCIALLQALYSDLDFNTVRLTGGKSLKGEWVIEVTMPDSPDAYGGWWVSIYSLDRLHKSAGTSANVSTVSEPVSASTDWTPQQLSYARPSTPVATSSSYTPPSSSYSSRSSYSGSSSGRVYVKSYYRKDGTYVRSHTRRK